MKLVPRLNRVRTLSLIEELEGRMGDWPDRMAVPRAVLRGTFQALRDTAPQYPDVNEALNNRGEET